MEEGTMIPVTVEELQELESYKEDALNWRAAVEARRRYFEDRVLEGAEPPVEPVTEEAVE